MEQKIQFKNFLIDTLLNEESNTGHVKIDQHSISSKLKNLEKQSNVSKDETTGFVIEDINGNEIKVWVRTSQAAAFERALAMAMTDEGLREMEVIELLFELRKKFDIVDAKWPSFKEDEETIEEPTDDQSDSEEPVDTEEPTDDESGSEEPVDTEEPTDNESGSEELVDDESAITLLQRILQTMSADAEAKKAEADARKAEAEAKAAEYAAMSMEKKVRDEEQLLDMERIEKEAKEAQKEAEKLAKLAKYRYNLRQGQSKEG